MEFREEVPPDSCLTGVEAGRDVALNSPCGGMEAGVDSSAVDEASRNGVRVDDGGDGLVGEYDQA